MDVHSRDVLSHFLLGEHPDIPPLESARLASRGEAAVAKRLGITRAHLRTRILAHEHYTDSLYGAVVALDAGAVSLELRCATEEAEKKGLELNAAIVERLYLSRKMEKGARRKAIETLLYYVVAGRTQDIAFAAESLHTFLQLERTGRRLAKHGL